MPLPNGGLKITEKRYFVALLLSMTIQVADCRQQTAEKILFAMLRGTGQVADYRKRYFVASLLSMTSQVADDRRQTTDWCEK